MAEKLKGGDSPLIYTSNVDSDDEIPEDNHEEDKKPTTSRKRKLDSTDDYPETSSFSKSQEADKDDDDKDEFNEPAAKLLKADNHTKVVATHYNKLEEKGLAERSKSKIFYMRNFNNWIKSILINEFLTKIKNSLRHGEPLRVLDMCCGKGGDLLKWEKSGITHLICTDIAEISIQQCEERYRSMEIRQKHNRFSKLFSAEFFACDSTLQRLREKYKDPSIELNMVSCQFAFHYCFESLKQAECMIRNAAECLRENGYFIGTIPDAYEIIRRQQIANSREFGNDIYKINFLCDPEATPLFGAKYNFELDGVVNCPEFLVNFPLLEKLARKFGLRLVMKQRFAEYFDKNKVSGS